MRKQATVLGLAAVIASATFLAPATASAAGWEANCKQHSHGKVCARKNGNKIEVKYIRTANGEAYVKLGYRNGTSRSYDNTYQPARKGSRDAVASFSYTHKPNVMCQGLALGEGQSDALTSHDFSC